MKSFALSSLMVPAAAFAPGIAMQLVPRSGVWIASPSKQQAAQQQQQQPLQLYYYRSGRDNPNDNNDSSFDDLRREFTSSSSEPSAEQVKQVVDRTFRFFQTLNREAVTSTTERSRNDDVLDKLQQWIERTIDIADEFTKDFPEQESPGPVAGAASGTSTRNENGYTVPLGVTASTPNTNAMADDLAVDNRRTTADAFEVQLDVPGVELADLDIRLDEALKIVTVLGQRGGRSFSRGVALDAEADTDHLSATLKNGVLTLRAPKVKPLTNNLKRIPVVVEDA